MLWEVVVVNNKDLFQKVKGLKLPTGQYALFGSTPLGIRGLKNCHDADIIVTEDVWNKFVNKTGWVVCPLECGRSVLVNSDCDLEIEMGTDWGPGKWNPKELIENAEIIDGLPFVRLEDVLKWKKIFHRPKDVEDIKTIEEFLQTKV